MSVQETLDRGEALNAFQKVALTTKDVVAPANAVDAAAFVGAAWSAPRFDTWDGIIVGGLSYGVDAVDGALARITGTESELGAKVDAGGDKIKVIWGLINVLRNNQAPKSLLTIVAAQNLANAAIYGLDHAVHDEPHITEVTRIGKRAMATQVAGVGLNVIGNKVAEDKPALGKALKVTGTILGFAGFATYGLASTKEYWRQYREDPSTSHLRSPRTMKEFTDLQRIRLAAE